MPGVSRVGDVNSAGGKLTRGASTVFLDGKPVALHTSPVTPHQPWGTPHPPHNNSVTTSGSGTVICEGSPVVRIGSTTSCGHSIVGGSESTTAP